MTKYNNKKVYVNGIKFDSHKEMCRYLVLKDMQEKGLISDLQTQAKFVLIPAQFEPDKVGARGGKIKGKCLEKQAVYTADFAYIDNRTGEKVVEDVKGGKATKTEAYVLRRKLMLKEYGIRIKEV